jgi:catechol 2,3-dioxygenase-like lactoylglutathione lyase family enzyme
MPALGPDFVALQVRDLDASARFYTEVLGLEVDPSGPPPAVVFRTQPIPLAVRDAVEPLPDGRLGTGLALWIRATGVDALLAAAEAAGCPVVERPAMGAFGRQATFLDPDGYRITLHGE